MNNLTEKECLNVILQLALANRLTIEKIYEIQSGMKPDLGSTIEFNLNVPDSEDGRMMNVIHNQLVKTYKLLNSMNLNIRK